MWRSPREINNVPITSNMLIRKIIISLGSRLNKLNSSFHVSVRAVDLYIVRQIIKPMTPA